MGENNHSRIHGLAFGLLAQVAPAPATKQSLPGDGGWDHPRLNFNTLNRLLISVLVRDPRRRRRLRRPLRLRLLLLLRPLHLLQ